MVFFIEVVIRVNFSGNFEKWQRNKEIKRAISKAEVIA